MPDPGGNRLRDSSTVPALYRRLLPAAVFVVALIPRVVHLTELRSNAPTFYRPEGGDSIFYDRVASGEKTPSRAYFHSPLYQWFLTGLYRTFGRNLVLVRLVQHLLGALTAVLVYLIAMSLFARLETALAAALVSAFFGPGIFYEGQLLVDSILPFFVTLACLALIKLKDHPSGRLAFLAGAAVSVASFGRATVLIWLPLGMGWTFYLSRSWRRAGLLAAGAVLAVAPLTLRNYLVEKDLVLITSNSGINLYIGNNPKAHGAYNLPEGLWFRPGDPRDDFSGFKVAKAASGRALKSSELSRWWRKKALTYMEENPQRTLGLLLHKAALLVNDYEYPQLYNYYAYSDICPLLRFLPGAGVFLALSLVGLIWVLSTPAPSQARFAALLGIAFALSYLPFFVVGRYRSPTIALFAPMASWAATSLVDALRSRQWSRSITLMVAVASASFICFMPTEPRPNRTMQYMAFGDAAMKNGENGKAIRFFLRAAREQPGFMESRIELGRAYLRLGRLDEALAVFDKAKEKHDHLHRLHLYRGELYLRMGRLALAEGALKRAIDLDPGDSRSWLVLGRTLERLGRHEEAVQAYRSALVLWRGEGLFEKLFLRHHLFILEKLIQSDQSEGSGGARGRR